MPVHESESDPRTSAQKTGSLVNNWHDWRYLYPKLFRRSRHPLKGAVDLAVIRARAELVATGPGVINSRAVYQTDGGKADRVYATCE